MKKTYATSVDDHVGAFLATCRTIAGEGLNITRVSYNKAIDEHAIFIEVEGTPEEHATLEAKLAGDGFLSRAADRNAAVVMLEFRIPDVPGAVVRVLEVVSRYDINIVYMSSHQQPVPEDGLSYQDYRMGLLAPSDQALTRFMDEVSGICEVRRVDAGAEGIFDNTVFYDTFASTLASYMDIGQAQLDELKINVNLAMQTLAEQHLSPYRTFETIDQFAELLSRYRGKRFAPRITTHRITDDTEVTVIEPPAGSNTAIIRSGGDYLFVDTGYACYRDEMLRLYRRLVPGWDTISKHAFATHADVDHCGLLNLFDDVTMSPTTAESLRMEAEEDTSLREENPLHRPYIRICKILTGYTPTQQDKIRILPAERVQDGSRPLVHTGTFAFGELDFDVYEGAGGHLRGESVLIDYEHHVVFTGDIYVNLHDMTPEQAEYNRAAPVLMTSVDTDRVLAAQERQALFAHLGRGTWFVFPAHGAMKTYVVAEQ